jgi:hypothetical protein
MASTKTCTYHPSQPTSFPVSHHVPWPKIAHLDGVLVGQQVDDLESVGDDPDGQELLSVVPSVHHQRVDETLDDGHTALGELLLGVSAGGVGCRSGR